MAKEKLFLMSKKAVFKKSYSDRPPELKKARAVFRFPLSAVNVLKKVVNRSQFISNCVEFSSSHLQSKYFSEIKKPKKKARKEKIVRMAVTISRPAARILELIPKGNRTLFVMDCLKKPPAEAIQRSTYW